MAPHAVRQQPVESQACPAGQSAEVTQVPLQAIEQKRPPSTVQSARHGLQTVVPMQSPPHTGRMDGSHVVVVVAVVIVVVVLVVLVVILVLVVVVVVVVTQLAPPAGDSPIVGHASQQLEQPVISSPPIAPPAAVQCLASFFFLHFGMESVCGTQHTTNPGFPHTE